MNNIDNINNNNNDNFNNSIGKSIAAINHKHRLILNFKTTASTNELGLSWRTLVDL